MRRKVGEDRRRIGDQAEIGSEYFSDGFAVGIDVDELLLGLRCRWKAVVEAGNIAQPRAHRNDEIGIGQHLPVLRRISKAQMPRIERRAIVKNVLVFPGDGNRDAQGLGKPVQGRSAPWRRAAWRRQQ